MSNTSESITPEEIEEIRNDKRRSGLYAKYHVERTDNQDWVGRKHDGCDYFVLDITHDPFAIPALRAYSEACRAEYPNLAADLRYVAEGFQKPTEIIAENERRKLPHG